MRSKCFTSEGKEKSRATPGPASPLLKTRSHKLRVKGHHPAKTQFQSCLAAGINDIPPEGDARHPGPAGAWLKPQSHREQSGRAGAQQAPATPAALEGTVPITSLPGQSSAAGTSLVPGGKKSTETTKKLGGSPFITAATSVLH